MARNYRLHANPASTMLTNHTQLLTIQTASYRYRGRGILHSRRSSGDFRLDAGVADKAVWPSQRHSTGCDGQRALRFVAARRRQSHPARREQLEVAQSLIVCYRDFLYICLTRFSLFTFVAAADARKHE